MTQIDKMLKNSEPKELAGAYLHNIVSKVKGNAEELNDKQSIIHEAQRKKLAENYLYDELMTLAKKKRDDQA